MLAAAADTDDWTIRRDRRRQRRFRSGIDVVLFDVPRARQEERKERRDENCGWCRRAGILDDVLTCINSTDLGRAGLGKPAISVHMGAGNL